MSTLGEILQGKNLADVSTAYLADWHASSCNVSVNFKKEPHAGFLKFQEDI